MAGEPNSCWRELEVEVPAEVVEREMERVTREFARAVRIAGFRPGKAPANLVRSRFKDEIRSEVLHALIPDSFESAVREKRLRPVSGPRIEKLEFEPDKPLRFRATFEVLPEIRLENYHGLEIEPVKLEVREEDVARELEALREQAATLEPVAGRAVDHGDTAVVSLVGSVTRPKEAGRKPIVLEEVLCHVGAETTLEAFTQGLRGAHAGEERTIEVNYPEDYPEKELAGRSVSYQAKVKAIKHKQLPELDDEFAQQVGEFKTLDELKRKIRENLEAARARRERELTQQRLLDALLAPHDFPVPEALVEDQMDTRLERQVRVLLSQGIDPRRLDIDWARLRRQQHQAAERDVRVGLLLERIGETESIEVTESEVEQEVARIAQQSAQSTAAVRARLTSAGELDKIRRAIRNEKAVEFLLAHARVRGE
ncbi:MAG: trigger factor [Terriglobia bacterium]